MERIRPGRTRSDAPWWSSPTGEMRPGPVGAGVDTGRVDGPGLHWIGHSTVRVELAGSTVLTDPVLTRVVGPLRRVVPLPPAVTWSGVDLVLVSHLHEDHLHLPSLRLLDDGVRVVVPRGAGAWLRSRGVRWVDELAPGESLVHRDLERVRGAPRAQLQHRRRLQVQRHAPQLTGQLRGPQTRPRVPLH